MVGKIGRSGYEKKHMIELLDNWYDMDIKIRKILMKEYGWDTKKFNIKVKREEIFKSLQKMKSSIDYASYDEVKYKTGLAKGYHD